MIIIAHRGASGYLPEHTLPAKALAHAMGADFIEQDVVLTADDVPVVLHDVHLDTVTDVATIFQQRSRDDGRFYAIDFTLAEIRRLKVNERIDLKTGNAVYPRRFPVGESLFRVPTLAEELELIQGLNRSTGREVGIYPEIKKPVWHRRQGKDISRVVIDVLDKFDYRTKEDACYLQCFEPTECRRIHDVFKCQLRLIQLIGENDWGEAEIDYAELRTAEGLKEIATYAVGIGPRWQHVLDKQGQTTGLVDRTHVAGLAVHPYTFRVEEVPGWANGFDELVQRSIDAGIDGLFTDFPDRAVRVRNAHTDSSFRTR